jgi:hypothetical protein
VGVEKRVFGQIRRPGAQVGILQVLRGGLEQSDRRVLVPPQDLQEPGLVAGDLLPELRREQSPRARDDAAAFRAEGEAGVASPDEDAA